MAATNDQLEWRNTTSGGFGGGEAASGFHDLEGTATATAALGDYFFEDTTLGGLDGDHDGKSFVIVTGPATLFLARVTRSIAGSGFHLDQPLGASVAIGNTYRVFAENLNNMDVDATRSGLGQPRHRGWYVRNFATERIDDGFFYVKPVWRSKWVEYDIFADDRNGTTTTFPTFGSSLDGPTQANLDALDPDNDWSSDITATMGFRQQPRTIITQTIPTLTANTEHRGLYDRQRVLENAPPHEVRYLLVFQAIDQSAGVVMVALPQIISIAGYTPEATMGFDRKLLIGGGARVNIEMRNAETGLAVPDAELAAGIVSGPGAITVPQAGIVTGADGKTFISYASPTDQGQAGQMVEIGVRT